MRKTLLIGALAVAGLAGCASGPYYDAYGYGYGPGYDPYYGAPGYAPGYYGPDVSLGYYYYDSDGHRHWHDNQRWNGDRHWDGNGNGSWHDRGGDRGQAPNGSLPDLPGGGDWRGTPTPPGGDRSRFQQ